MMLGMRRLLLAFPVAFFALSCVSNLPDQDLRILTAQPAAKLSASDLWKDFEADASAARSRYFGKAIDVSDSPTGVEPSSPSGARMLFRSGRRARRHRPVARGPSHGNAEGRQGRHSSDAQVLLPGPGRQEGRHSQELHQTVDRDVVSPGFRSRRPSVRPGVQSSSSESRRPGCGPGVRGPSPPTPGV